MTNRKTVGLSIVFLVSLIVLILYIKSGEHVTDPIVAAAQYSDNRKYVTTADVVAGKYYARGANASFASTGVISFMSKSGDLITFDVTTRERKSVISADQFTFRPWKTKFNKENSLVLVSFSPQRVFRNTVIARYAVHDAVTGKLIKKLRVSGDAEEQAFQFVLLGSTSIYAVYRNDVYAVKLEGEESLRITSDGSEVISNGVADWVYEEEILTDSPFTLFLSHDERLLAYVKFNDTVVEPVTYNIYGDYSEYVYNPMFQYSKFGTVRYPKVGTLNPTVSVHVFTAGDASCWSSTPPGFCTWDIPLNSMMRSLTSVNENFILGQLDWSKTTHDFSLLVLNRIQNASWIVECSVPSRECKVVREVTQSNGWIDNAPLHRLNDEYVTLGTAQSGSLEYAHVLGYSDSFVRMHTNGEFNVDAIVSVTSISGNPVIIIKAPRIESSKTIDATQTHYYAFRPGGTVVCLTCDNCTSASAKFQDTMFLLTCENEDSVSITTINRINEDLSVEQLLVLEDNRYLQNLLDNVELPEVNIFKIPYKLRDKNYHLNVKTIGPAGWETSDLKYPVVMDTYSGPNSQKVVRKLSVNEWSYSLAGQGVVYVIVDGIGSGRESATQAFEVYRNLGHDEIIDKIFAMKYLLNKYESLDATKTVIWGWSYGGYTSAMTLGKDTGRVFKCGISVAPVVNWHYYDTMYTERYMSTPEDNPVGYNTSNVLNYIDNFKYKKFMLVHGNADDNVHYQQSMVLARALEQHAILFRLMSYPDENHSLGGVRAHLWKSLEDFLFNECFSSHT